MANQEAVEIAQLLKEWHENRIKQLRYVVDKGEDLNVKFEGKNGEQVELPKKHVKGFQYGIEAALELFQEFPITITEETSKDGE